MKKIVKLIDKRACVGASVRELRSVIRGIEAGDVTSVSFVIVRRDGSSKAYFDSECPLRALGSVDLLKDYIRNKKFELL